MTHLAPAALASLLLLASVHAAGSPETAGSLTAEGRALLAEGQPARAEERFEHALELDPAAREARVWLVRAHIAEGRVDDALRGCDELSGSDASAADVDYLYGLAFHAAALRAIASGGDAYTQGYLEDALRLLSSALEADPERYADAWETLADAGLRVPDLEVAYAAAARAVELEPERFEARALLGRAAFARYRALPADAAPGVSAGPADAARRAERDTLADEALEAFDRAIELAGEPPEADRQANLAQAYAERGSLRAWRKELDRAAESWGDALTWDPSSVDLGTAHRTLGAERFGRCIARGDEGFRARHGEDDARVATLAWWHGFASYEAARWEDAEALFREAAGRWPAYVNSWYYVFRACLAQDDGEGAADALRDYLERDAEGLVATLAADLPTHRYLLDKLVGACAGARRADALVDAALACELLTRVEPDASRHWNNLGLFLRDEGDRLRAVAKRDGTTADAATLEDLFERSYDAYSRALELEPDNPAYVNDTAVLLHYYLGRELDLAESMYARATAAAEARLEEGVDDAGEREVIETALRDSKDNLARLRAARAKHGG